jgi:glycosyltransferase involved in cell wall biosynthesis
LKLLVISHTEHYKNSKGEIVGLASTVTELNHLLAIFEEIYHIGVFYNSAPVGNTLSYKNEKITFIPIQPYGGKRITDKLGILRKAPATIALVNSYLKKADYFQFRAPTGMGIYMIPFLAFATSKKGWFKYAGNWKQEAPPLGYAIQRWLLKKQNKPVTINGKWADAPGHCIAFENPGLSTENRIEGKKVLAAKTIKKPFNLCFVGRLEDAKGVDKILTALTLLSEEEQSLFSLDMVGTGEKENAYKSIAASHRLKIRFHGALPREAVFDIFKESDFLLLPSKSEGFPKVIGEAMNFGCIPVTSKVSSIGQYVIDGKNGFLIEPNTPETLTHIFKRVLFTEGEIFQQMIMENYKLAAKFTYEYYIDKIKKQLLH